VAEDTGRGRRGRTRASGSSAEKDDRTPTERVVLKRERVLILPDRDAMSEAAQAEFDKAVKAAQDAIRKVVRPDPRAAAQLTEAWVEVARATGDKRQAIEAYAGEPDTPTAKPGVYKAPPVRGFAGGRQYDRPPEPKVEAKDID
jgi:hypothetical protein